MELVPGQPNVTLRDGAHGEEVVLAFPYDSSIVEAVRRIPGRRFDWDSREWAAPVDDWVGVHVSSIIERFPDLETSGEVDAWLSGIEQRWVGAISTGVRGGTGHFTLRTRAGQLPEELAGHAEEHDGLHWLPMTRAIAEELMAIKSARLDAPANRCISHLRSGLEPPPAILSFVEGVAGVHFKLDVLWDADAAKAFDALPGAGDRSRSIPVDPFLVEPLDAFLALHRIEVSGAAAPRLAEMRREHEEAQRDIAASKAKEGAPPDPLPRLGGDEDIHLEPFQWAGVNYLLHKRRAFLADEQGLGKTVQALAALEADDAFPAVVVCPASLKLNWEREAARWLPHRDTTVLSGRGVGQRTGEITVLNYELVAAHKDQLARLKPRALILDESHYCKNPQAKRTQAVRRLAAAVPENGLKLALSGTPVLNHPEELIPQLRIIGRLEDFGSGAKFARQFQGDNAEERLHWHLRRRCFVRRLKVDVLPQLPAKRQVVVPMELSNQREYRLAEEDVIAWLREQPLDLRELDAKIAATLRTERLVQLGVLKRLAAKGKLQTALSWIHDFLQSGEPLVVFAHHQEVQEAVLERFPDAAHLLGRDAVAAREATVQAFQEPDGPQLIVCATRVAAQGITLTRASNVAFLELEWTPAMHDQAEDRCHRMGQHDAVTAWYLLAAGTIDETISAMLQRKRGLVGAVTDGTRDEGEALVASVVRELRGKPYKHLRPVA
ncbi:MAG: helicase domain protein [Solirubrobacterales bacterium]|jgi:SWI/SNF-related matrix-associated actin-dependent regulator 1 of chromatin subfamily A|nr:helicase domain protein [Solirubrobacterales bacterium]